MPQVLLALTILGIISAIRAFFKKKANERMYQKLGKVCRKSLHLEKEEEKSLNRIGKWEITIPFCDEEAAKLFLRGKIKLQEQNKWEKKSSFANDLFTYCQYQVLQTYDVPLSNSARNNYELTEGKLFSDIRECIFHETKEIPPLDNKRGRILYNQSTSHWKPRFEKIMQNYSPYESQSFYEEITRLASLTDFVTSKRDILFRAHQFLADKDKILSALLYIHYRNVKSASGTFKYKGIAARDKKLLFKNQAQEIAFQKLVEQSINLENPEDISIQVKDLFTIKRKTITLDNSAVYEAQQEHAVVVELLSEYLSDEEVIQAEKIINDSKEIIYSSENNNTLELLNLFLRNNYLLNTKEVDIFAQSKNVFKNQLIDKINEQYYETFDDLVIEEDGENYILNKNYYLQMQAQT